MIAYRQRRLAFVGRVALECAGASGAAAGAAVGAAGAAVGSVLDAAPAWVLLITVGLLRPQSIEMLTPMQDYQVTSCTADNL